MSSSLVIDETKVRKAVKALFQYERRQQPTTTKNVWLIINVYEAVDLFKSQPVRILLKHSLQTPGTQRCLITKDPSKPIKDFLTSKNIKGIHKVLGISKFKKDYSTQEAKKTLMAEYNEFLVDTRILKLMPQVLGKEVYKKRREPMPLDVRKKDMQKEVIRAVRSTCMEFCTGTCYSVKISSTHLNESQTVENVIGSLQAIVDATYGGADNIRSLMLKTAESLSLPLYEAEGENATVTNKRQQHEEEEEEEEVNDDDL
ncbi:ribosomal protein L1/ribosomal biogenesis protein [Spinellus fusiger]|nr:ribosomal protein L1/ribosomal biogenesis protein [Spinellus fusiger]